MLTTGIDDRPRAYRYEEVHYSLGTDEWGDALPGSSLRITLREYPIEKTTPKGMWISAPYGSKFVNLTARKKWACATKKEALESYIFRKKAQLRTLSAQLRNAERALNMTLTTTGIEVDGFRVIMPNHIDFDKLEKANDVFWG